MPAPTTKPKPSPKSPPVCKKGPPGLAGPPATPDTRILTAQVTADIDLPGYPKALQTSFAITPTGTPYHWYGTVKAAEIYISVGLFKNAADDRYAVYIGYNVSEIPFFQFEWFNQTPPAADPLRMADLYHKPAFSNNAARLTIMS